MLMNNIVSAGALISLVAAVPLQHVHKRDLVWETKIEWAYTTIPVTSTVWLEPGETAPAQAPHHGHHHNFHKKVTSHIRQTITVSPSPVASPAESSPYSAPTQSEASPAPAAPTTTAYTPPATSPTTAAPAPTTTQSSGGGSSGSGLSGMAAPGTSYTGDLTWYQDGLGACGLTNGPSDHIVAISEVIFDSYATANPNDNPVCGLTVTITGANGSPYVATVVDRCTGCAESDLDLSEDFFNTVTNNGDGRVPGMHWKFN